MTYTYIGNLSTNLDKVRFYIGDVVSGTGPKPTGGNFTDEEIGGLITAEGSWEKAVAAIFEILAGMYSSYVDITVGPRREALSQASKSYREQASEWRSRYGGSSSTAGARAVTRTDGYSDDIASDEV